MSAISDLKSRARDEIGSRAQQFCDFQVDRMTDVGYASCPYYLGTGICGGGCYDEPRCQTGEPEEGWGADRWSNRLLDSSLGWWLYYRAYDVAHGRRRTDGPDLF